MTKYFYKEEELYVKLFAFVILEIVVELWCFIKIWNELEYIVNEETEDDPHKDFIKFIIKELILYTLSGIILICFFETTLLFVRHHSSILNEIIYMKGMNL